MRAWIARSFRNRIFITVLLAALVPLLLCDLLMTQLMIERSEQTLRQEAQTESAALGEKLDELLALCTGTARSLAESTVSQNIELTVQAAQKSGTFLKGTMPTIAAVVCFAVAVVMIATGILNKKAGIGGTPVVYEDDEDDEDEDDD